LKISTLNPPLACVYSVPAWCAWTLTRPPTTKIADAVESDADHTQWLACSASSGPQWGSRRSVYSQERTEPRPLATWWTWTLYYTQRHRD